MVAIIPKMQPVVVQWLVDVRGLWPEAAKAAQLKSIPQAARALALLPENERASVMRFFHVQDAKMSLVSHLVKHYVVSKFAHIPWSETNITRDARMKPVYVDPETGRMPVSFNVSHQAGLVAIVAVSGWDEAVNGPADVGVDLVCVGERRARDHKIIRGEVGGWQKFVDIHADVFSPLEAHYLKYGIMTSSAIPARLRPSPGSPENSEAVVDFKLRCFYALWNLREAWVKMTGEALLAEWLDVLEFRNFRPPTPTVCFHTPAQEDGESDEVINNHEVIFRGKCVDDANVSLRAMGPDFMVCTAVRTPQRMQDGLSWRLGPYEPLNVDEILEFAELHP